MKRILVVGACYIDTVLDVTHYPDEDEKLRASSLLRRRGGNCPNSLEVLQQLVQHSSSAPVSLTLCSVLPAAASAGTALIRASFGPLVDLSHCIYREQCTEPASSYIFKSRASGSRTIVNYNNLPEMTVSEFDDVIERIDGDVAWCHFEGRIPDVTLQCIRNLRQRQPDVTISVEVEKPGREGLKELAAEADVVFFSKSWALGHGYNTAEECLQAQVSRMTNVSLLFCTWGDHGASALDLSTLLFRHKGAFTTEGSKVLDSIGAGDTFIAGMLYALNFHRDDWTLERKLEFANEIAGRKILQEGFSGLGLTMQDFDRVQKTKS